LHFVRDFYGVICHNQNIHKPKATATQEGAMEERRRSPRTRLQKKVIVIDMSNGETVGELIDISPEGMHFKASESIKQGAVMELRLLLPVKIFGKDLLDVEVLCVWTKSGQNSSDCECGVEFVEVATEDAGILLGLIMDLGIPEE
jgi:hypothetical protein